jgi:hypothetical protein
VEEDDARRRYEASLSLGGYEFDFLATDAVGQVAVFSHAGWGPIPRVVVDRSEQATKAVEAAERLPVTTTVQDAPVDGGDYSEWLTKVECGLFAYDWWDTYGPYRLVARPRVAIHIDAAPSLLDHGNLAVLPTDFALNDTIDFTSLGIDLVEYPRHRA